MVARRSFEAEYHATISYGGSKIGNDAHLAPLLDFVQRMHLTFSIGHVDLCLSGEHYRNDLNSDTHLNTLFVDASLIYKTKNGDWKPASAICSTRKSMPILPTRPHKAILHG